MLPKSLVLFLLLLSKYTNKIFFVARFFVSILCVEGSFCMRRYFFFHYRVNRKSGVIWVKVYDVAGGNKK